MDNRDRLINDLAIQNTQLRIENMQLNYEIEALKQALLEAQNGNTKDNNV